MSKVIDCFFVFDLILCHLVLFYILYRAIKDVSK